ncbi:MAG: universal stress protein [Steroidobacteraceae bacterium]
MSLERLSSILVVVVDPFRRHQLAVGKAAAIATKCGATLTLLNVFMIPQPTPDTTLGSRRQIIASARRERLGRLRTLAAPLQRRGIKVSCVVEWDYPIHDAIVRQVLALKPDLLMADSHRHGRIARWLLTNTDWELIRHCPCPIWFVRQPKLSAKPKFLVAVDPRHTHEKPARLDVRLLQAANACVSLLGGRISLIHAYQPTQTLDGSNVSRMPVFIEDTQEMLRKMAAPYGIGTADQHVLPGEPSEVLSSFADRAGTEILVMGAVSRSFKKPVIGNTAERVIDRVDCDLLVIKSAGFKSAVTRAA